MLVLTRKHQEKIRIGDNITITILKTKGKAVRVGIEAPDEIAVVRGELVAKGTATQAVANLPAEQTAEAAAPARRPLRRTPVETSWTTDSRPISEESPRRRQPALEVTLQRVARKDAVKLLPRLSGDVSPLRSMIERRATV